MKKISVIVFSLVLLLVFTSCASRVSGSLSADGQADLNVYASLEPRMTALLGGLAEASGTTQPGTPLLDGPSINASMAAAPGVMSVSLVNTSPTAIEGPIKISRLGDFLSHDKAQGFISFEQSSASNNGRCAIDLDRNSGPDILSLLSAEIVEYLDALMAPLVTGEELTKTEYLALVRSVYGNGIADEISRAVVHASIDFPGLVQSVRGGSFSGRRAEFEIPLLDLLVLEMPFSCEVAWR